MLSYMSKVNQNLIKSKIEQLPSTHFHGIFKRCRSVSDVGKRKFHAVQPIRLKIGHWSYLAAHNREFDHVYLCHIL